LAEVALGKIYTITQDFCTDEFLVYDSVQSIGQNTPNPATFKRLRFEGKWVTVPSGNLIRSGHDHSSFHHDDFQVHAAEQIKIRYIVTFGFRSSMQEMSSLKRKTKALLGQKPLSLDFPLHHACQIAAPAEYILVFLQAKPELAAIKNKEGDLALHLAAANKATSLQVIEALLVAFADGIKQQNNDGQAPLHAALQGRATREVLSLLGSHPEEFEEEPFAFMSDCDGCTHRLDIALFNEDLLNFLAENSQVTLWEHATVLNSV
jgi:hypothetical protein